MLVVYLLVLIVLGFALVVLVRPASSIDTPPGLMELAIGSIVLVPPVLSAYVRRTRPAARTFELVLATLLMGLGVLVLGFLGAYLTEGPLPLDRVLGGYLGIVALTLPGSLAGSWWGGRGARAAAAAVP